MGGKQLGFGDYEQTTATKRTRREKFLAEMDAVVPWQALIALIEPADTTVRRQWAPLHRLLASSAPACRQATITPRPGCWPDSGWRPAPCGGCRR
jgi:hypothetical protein